MQQKPVQQKPVQNEVVQREVVKLEDVQLEAAPLVIRDLKVIIGNLNNLSYKIHTNLQKRSLHKYLNTLIELCIIKPIKQIEILKQKNNGTID